MTHDSQQRINTLLSILNAHAPQLDLHQIGNLMIDLAESVEQGERQRNLTLLGGAYRYLHSTKGRGWRHELENLEREISIGTQTLFR
jgi:hypothetical protein